MSPNSSWKTRTGERGTLLGPLTTTAWSPPAGCGVHLVGCATCADGYQAQHCVGGAPQDFTGCWPPVASKVASPNYPYLGWGYYSPGLACPTGYTAACTATSGVRPDWPIQFDLFPGETAIGCCPSGFQCANNDGNTCYAVVSATATVVPTGVCSSGAIVGITQATLPAAAFAATTTGADAPEFTLWAPMFQLNHRLTDLPTVSTTSLSSSAQSGASTTSSTAPPDPNAEGAGSTSVSTSSSPTAGAQGGGLSTAAVAGIGVGAAIGALLLAAIAGCLWWARVRRGREAAAAAAAAAAGDGDWNPAPPNTWPPADGAHYYGSSSEMPTKEALAYVRAELDQMPSAVELPAGGHPPWRDSETLGHRR